MALSDKQQKDMGKTIQAGISQLSNPTPQWMKYVIRTVLYLSAIWAGLSGMFTEIPADTLNIINKYLIIANAFLSITIKFFGWSNPDS